MTFLLILIILFYIVFGIVDVRFGFLCKKEQRKNKTIAQIYVGTKKIVWILGTIFFLIGILEVLLLLFSFNIVPLYDPGFISYTSTVLVNELKYTMSALPVPDGLEAILLVIRYSTYPPDISDMNFA